MGVTPLYLEVEDKNVFILGTGEVATRRANRFLDKGANVVLVGENINSELLEKGAILKPSQNLEALVEWSDFVVVASGDRQLSDHVSKIASDKLLNRADFPQKGNVIVPTSFNIGEIEISIFTNGKSPLMARQLRKKIQSVITEEDILEIELQDYARSRLRDVLENQKERKEYLYKIFEDDEINGLIQNHEIDKAKECIDNLIRGLM